MYAVQTGVMHVALKKWNVNEVKSTARRTVSPSELARYSYSGAADSGIYGLFFWADRGAESSVGGSSTRACMSEQVGSVRTRTCETVNSEG